MPLQPGGLSKPGQWNAPKGAATVLSVGKGHTRVLYGRKAAGKTGLACHASGGAAKAQMQIHACHMLESIDHSLQQEAARGTGDVVDSEGQIQIGGPQLVLCTQDSSAFSLTASCLIAVRCGGV